MIIFDEETKLVVSWYIFKAFTQFKYFFYLPIFKMVFIRTLFYYIYFWRKYMSVLCKAQQIDIKESINWLIPEKTHFVNQCSRKVKTHLALTYLNQVQ